MFKFLCVLLKYVPYIGQGPGTRNLCVFGIRLHALSIGRDRIVSPTKSFRVVGVSVIRHLCWASWLTCSVGS